MPDFFCNIKRNYNLFEYLLVTGSKDEFPCVPKKRSKTQNNLNT